MIECDPYQTLIIQDEKWGSTIGLPGTRNVIKKWSLAHLGGIDLTALGPPGGREASKLSGNVTSKFQVMFKKAFGSKPHIESAVHEVQVDPYNQKDVIANADTIKNTDPPDDLFKEMALPKEAEAEIEEAVGDDREEEESMDGDKLESFTDGENVEEEESGNERDSIAEESER